MNNKEAIEYIEDNWPPADRSELREALTMAVAALKDTDTTIEHCLHDWFLINNEHVSGIEICTKCHELRGVTKQDL